jgi:hypothetical protein
MKNKKSPKKVKKQKKISKPLDCFGVHIYGMGKITTGDYLGKW